MAGLLMIVLGVGAIGTADRMGDKIREHITGTGDVNLGSERVPALQGERVLVRPVLSLRGNGQWRSS